MNISHCTHRDPRNYQSKHQREIDNFNNEEQNITREQTENLRQSAIDSSITNAGTKSDLMVQQSSIEKASETTHKSIDYSNMDRGEAFIQGGLAGLLDKTLTNCTNMTSGQKDARKTLSVLGCFAGGIFGLYKFYTTKKLKWRGKIGITAATIFTSQAITGEGPISLFTKLITGCSSQSETENKLGDAVSALDNSGSEAAETTVPAIYSMMIFNSSTKKSDVDKMTEAFKTNNENRKSFYNQSCQKIKNKYGEAAMKTFQGTFSEKFDKGKWRNWLAQIGITGATDSRKTVYELADNANTNKIAFEKFLADNKLKPTTNPSKKVELNRYIISKNEKCKTINFKDLKAHINDRFIPIDSPTNPSHESSEQQQNPNPQNPNPQNPEQQNNQNIELKNETLKPAVEKGLSTIFNHFKSEYGFIVSTIGVNQSTIPKYSQGITNDIISNLCHTNGKNINLDLSDNNIKQVYNNFINKLANDHSGAIKARIKVYDWNGLKSKLRNRRTKGKTEKYNKRKNNFSVIFNSLFNEIIPVIQSQGGEIKITSNGQEFNNVNDAITSLQILNNPYA